MKFRIFISAIVVSFILLVRCTDKELYEPIKIMYPDHCSNGIVDGDEIGVDCGGECAPCGTIAAPCNPDTNKITFDSATATSAFPNSIKTFTMPQGGTNDIYGNYIITSNYNGGEYLQIVLSGTRPTIARAYNISGQEFGGNYYPGNGQLFFHFSNGQSTKSISGTLYVKPVGNSLIFTFCHAKFGSNSSQTIGFNYSYGRILSPN